MSGRPAQIVYSALCSLDGYVEDRRSAAFLFPVVVGRGKRMISEGVELHLELSGERRFASGVVYLRHGVYGA